jgi:hypothetical protein
MISVTGKIPADQIFVSLEQFFNIGAFQFDRDA